MNISKHMEAIFVAILAVASVTGVATASRPAQPAPVQASVQAEAPVQVVTISAKRLTPAQKAAAQ